MFVTFALLLLLSAAELEEPAVALDGGMDELRAMFDAHQNMQITRDVLAREAAAEAISTLADEFEAKLAMAYDAAMPRQREAVDAPESRHVELGFAWDDQLEQERKDGLRSCQRAMGPAKQCAPLNMDKVEALDDHTVKFYFADGISRRSLIETVGGVPAWPQHWFEETGNTLKDLWTP